MTPGSAPSNRLGLPVRVRDYLDAVESCAQAGSPLVSLVIFGSASKGGFSAVSDVDLIVVLSDETTPEQKRRLRKEIARLEIDHGFRPESARSMGALQARIERAAGHLFPCCVCTRSDLLSGDVARILDLRPWEAVFADRIIFAGIVSSAMTVSGEDLLPLVAVPSVHRFDVFKAFFAISCQLVLSAIAFPILADATRYAMGALKHSLHSCYFCYHHRTAPLDEEVAFFNRRFGASRTLVELLALRRRYRRSLGFILRCLPTIARLHLTSARDNRFTPAVDAGR